MKLLFYKLLKKVLDIKIDKVLDEFKVTEGSRMERLGFFGCPSTTGDLEVEDILGGLRGRSYCWRGEARFEGPEANFVLRQ